MIDDLPPSYNYTDLDVTFASDREEGHTYPLDRMDGIGIIFCSDVIGPQGEVLDDQNYAPDNIVIDLESKELIGVFNKDVVVITALSDDNVAYINELISERTEQGLNSELCMGHGRVVEGAIKKESKFIISTFII